MSGEEEISTVETVKSTASTETETNTTTTTTAAAAGTETVDATDVIVEQERSDKILKAKELYSQGSRNYLVKSYAEAADELSQVCALYEELHGELSPELGMPYLLYAKCLIALAVDENKVIDVPDEADEDDDDEEEEVEGEDAEDDEEEVEEETTAAATSSKSNGTDKSAAEADSSADPGGKTKKTDLKETETEKQKQKEKEIEETKETTEQTKVESTTPAKTIEEAEVSSSKDDAAAAAAAATKANGSATIKAKPVVDGEKPSTSNGDAVGVATDMHAEDEENEAVSNLQLAWEILELAASIFLRQGLGGLPNLAEVLTELGNIEFENNIMDAARKDYEKALGIYKGLPTNYHRAMAEIHYKIGLTYLMQQAHNEGAASFKKACALIDAEISQIKSKDGITEKDKSNIQDMEETNQEIRAKIDEIEEIQAQNIADVRAALDSYIKPIHSQNAEGAGTSSSSSSSAKVAAAATTSNISSSSSKPTDISHLIKRKKPEEPSSEAEASPAKRPAV